MKQFDIIILGAGLYGLYSCLRCGEAGKKVLVLDCDSGPFRRATYINQARVHMGYHYPRSFTTAIKSAHYFERFCKDYGFSNLINFNQIYATSANFSWTSAAEFRCFCRNANIKCEDISPDKFFNPGMCDGTFLTTEYTYDAQILKKWFLEQLDTLPNIEIFYNHRPEKIERIGDVYRIKAADIEAETPFILNATYAGINDIHRLMGIEPFKIKYELCEIILCTVNEKLRDTGITVMDGPFFSLMPFGKTGYHSLTSVTFTPHETSYDSVPTFRCQKHSGGLCQPGRLYNCNDCPAKPVSAWPYMSQLVKKYLKPEYGFDYARSLYSMKPVLKASEIDDSRPTNIWVYSKEPTFISVLSGKINTVYDLDEVLEV